jgi:hypothetical protein
MDDIGLDVMRAQPTRKPEAVAASLISHDNALDLAHSLAGFIAPTMQELEQPFLLRIEFLKGLAFTAGDKCRGSHFDWLISITGEPVAIAHEIERRLPKPRCHRLMKSSVTFS